MQWDTAENYKRRRERLKEQIAAALCDIPEKETFTEAQTAHLRDLVAEKSELLHWRVYNDSFSRNASWLYNDYIRLDSNEARLAILAFRADLSLRHSEFAAAFRAYLNMIRRGRISDPYVAAWMETHDADSFGTVLAAA